MSPFGEKIIDRDRLVVDKRKFLRRPRPRSLLPVGAKNPYAVADGRLGDETPKWDKNKPPENRKELAKIIGDGRPYQHLFDPLYGSCLFCPDIVKKIQKSISKEWLEELGEEIYAGTYAAGAPPPGGNDTIKKWGLLTNPRWFSKPGVRPGIDDPHFNNPVQRGSFDCYFIAALSSIAWVHYDTTNLAAKINTAANKSINFYPRPENPRIGTGSPPPGVENYIRMFLEMPLDAAGNPACAISSEYSSSKEYWPTFYEKAYARYRLSKNHITNWETTHQIYPTYDDHPDVNTLPCGDPFATLTLLTNIPCYIYDMMNNPNCPRDPGLIWDKLGGENGLCYPNEGNPSRKTKYPAVAITNCTKDPEVPPTLDPPYPVCAAPAGSKVVYDEELLIADHAYSLLGIHETNAGRYVILRNPWGTNWGFIMGSNSYRLADGTLDFHVPIQPTPYSFTWDLFEENPTTHFWTAKEGVFAMHYEDFANWFGAFGWIVI